MTDESNDPDDPAPDGFDLLIDNARYLIDYQWRRSASFEARATQMLAASAVILTLAATWMGQGVHRFKLAVLLLIGVSVVLLIGSAACAVACIAPRKTLAPDTEQFHRTVYHGYRTEPYPRYQLQDQIASMYVSAADGSPDSPGLIDTLGTDATLRAKWLTRSLRCFVFSLAPVAAAGIVMLAGR